MVVSLSNHRPVVLRQAQDERRLIDPLAIIERAWQKVGYAYGELPSSSSAKLGSQEQAARSLDDSRPPARNPYPVTALTRTINHPLLQPV